MSIHFVIGRAGSGKTTYCLEQIRERLRREPDGAPLILLVPEQATYQAELALVSTPDLAGIMRAQVLSFRRLAWRVMQETGGIVRPPINESGKKMLLHKIIHTYRHELKLFHASVDQAGFLDQLIGLFTEWKRYMLTGERLKQHLEGAHEIRAEVSPLLADKLHDLQRIYSIFEAELAGTYLDGEDYVTLLAEKYKDVAYLCQAEIWVDGFHGFTPQEYAVLETMMRHSRRLTLTLCLDREYGSGERPRELDLFHPTARTMVALREMADRLGVPQEVVRLGGDVLPRYRESRMLAALEASLARQSVRPVPGFEEARADITLCEAVNRRAEAEGVAREMIRLVREEGVRWRDLAVRVRNIEAYGDLLETVFDDYGIPYFLDHKRTVLHHPLVEFVRSALEVVERNWRYDAVFRCVKTEFLFPLVPDEEAEEQYRHMRHAMDELENYVLAFGIQGSRWTDGRPWNYRWSDALDEEEETGRGPDAQANERVERCRSLIVRPLSLLQQRIRRAKNVRDMAEALFRLLEETDAPGRLEQWSREELARGRPEKAREHAQVWGSVVDLLDQMVEAAGEERMPLKLFITLLETGLESLRLGLVPPAIDQVLIGTVDRTRSVQVKHVFVLGVNEGVLPARFHEEGVLTEEEREALLAAGLPMADGCRRKLLDEEFLIYTTLCAPSHRLWLSYALADEEGKTLLPSEVIRRMERRFPGLRKRLILTEPAGAPDEAESLQYVSRPRPTMSLLTSQLRQWLRGNDVSPIWWDVYNWFAANPEWREATERMARALFFVNRERPLTRETSIRLYGESIAASVSRMERFAACPFSQFVSHGLRLKERRIYRLEAPDIGRLFHAALSRIALRLGEEGADWGQLDAHELTRLSEAVVDELSPRLVNEILFSSARHHYIARKLKNIVGRAAAMLGEHARRGAFRPIGLELGFGPGEKLPPLWFALENGGTMSVRGRIDRIDRADGERGMLLRVIDYKSSRTSLSLTELLYGLSLQMLTYLDVVLTHAESWLGRPALPAGVLYFHVHNPLIRSNNALPRDKAEAELRKRFKMRGLLLADAEAVCLMDRGLKDAGGRSELIPAALKADGQFYKASSVATDAQWKQLIGYVRGAIRRIGNGIAAGDVGIAPYRLGQKTPCAFCEYRAVCQFDPQFAGNGYRMFSALDNDAVWRAIGEDPAASRLSFTAAAAQDARTVFVLPGADRPHIAPQAAAALSGSAAEDATIGSAADHMLPGLRTESAPSDSLAAAALSDLSARTDSRDPSTPQDGAMRGAFETMRRAMDEAAAGTEIPGAAETPDAAEMRDHAQPGAGFGVRTGEDRAGEVTTQTNADAHANTYVHAGADAHANVDARADDDSYAEVDAHADADTHKNTDGHANAASHTNVASHVNAVPDAAPQRQRGQQDGNRRREGGSADER